ncbi:MAG: phosphotransferase [Rhodococcus sp. (in: high G+C Gram-positive bacteria)]
MEPVPCAVLVVGAQASGKSSVARLLAERVPRGAFIEGDVLWKMIVAGAVDMSGDASAEADQQLALRYRHGALLCESFVAEGFVAVHAENMYGPPVERHLQSLRCARSLVVLRPRPEVIEERERMRGTSAYRPWIPPGGSLRDAVIRFDEWVAATPRIGLWVDSSDQTVDQTVDFILDRWAEATVA